MKKVLRNHSEVAHVWASQSQDVGEGCNMSFRGPTLYSYGTAIMRFCEHKGKTFILVNSTNYSISSCKHMSHARNAVRHVNPKFEIGGLSHGVSLDYDNPGREFCAWALEQAADCLKKSEKARTNKAWLLERSLAWRTKAQEVSDFFGLRKKVNEKSLEKLRKKKEKATKEYAKEIKKSLEEWMERKRLRLIEAEKELELWMKGEETGDNGPLSYFYDLPVKLRVKDKREIETSCGGIVPYESGRRLFKLYMSKLHEGWEAGKDGEFRIGNYRLNLISAQGVKVGCHFIDADEIQRFSEQEGWAVSPYKSPPLSGASKTAPSTEDPNKWAFEKGLESS